MVDTQSFQHPKDGFFKKKKGRPIKKLKSGVLKIKRRFLFSQRTLFHTISTKKRRKLVPIFITNVDKEKLLMSKKMMPSSVKTI